MALMASFRAAAKEYGFRGIRFNAVAPGLIDTPAVHNAGGLETFQPLVDATALQRIGKPTEIAHVVAFLLSEESSFIDGEVISADGGFRC
ncbi:hypothetical protein FOPE_06053 [Fonsecaea pedrosoi]|nr:hypothetical protein FOPE_06053 [Fonsecaea pedrosoi]